MVNKYLTKEAGSYNGPKTVYSMNGVEKTGQIDGKKKKLNHQLMPYTNINSWWIKDLNKSHNTIKVLEENICSKFSDIPCSNILTDTSPKGRDIKERINKWDLIKIKSFWVA